jgi:hypothetical protein
MNHPQNSAMAGGSTTIAGGSITNQDNLPLLNAPLPRTPQKSFMEAKINQHAALLADAPINPTGLLGMNATIPMMHGNLDGGFGGALDEVIRILKSSPATTGEMSYGEPLRTPVASDSRCASDVTR